MSELKNARHTGGLIRWNLMAGVSMAALLAASLGNAHADDTDRPTIWIELGGQLERADGGQERFAPPFLSEIDPDEFTSPLVAQRPPRYATGFEGNLSFQPEGSDWVFSAGLRFGRSNNNRRLHQEGALGSAEQILSVPALSLYIASAVPAETRRYSDTTVRSNESHATVDFMVGKDVGLGLFGRDSTSVLNAGVRFAQFESQSKVTIGGDLDFAINYKYATQAFGFSGYFKVPQQQWHLNRSSAEITRSFHGVGPSVAWQSSAPMIGNAERAEVTLDWGINAAVLFGRQRAKVHHETHRYHHYQSTGGALQTTTAVPNIHDTSRSRSVAVPNVGGFAGLSLKFPNAKISMGYRADVFFGAMDGGIDTRQTYDRAFYGPFASFSVGLGG